MLAYVRALLPESAASIPQALQVSKSQRFSQTARPHALSAVDEHLSAVTKRGHSLRVRARVGGGFVTPRG